MYNNDVVKELKRQIAMRDDEINTLQWYAREHKQKLNRLATLNKVTLSFSKLITLKSPILSPELSLIASTMHLGIDKIINVNPTTWKRANSHTGQIATAVGGFGAVEKVYQLPAKGGHQANIIFANPEARKAGFAAVKDRYKHRAPAMKYSLQQFPKLRFQDRCLQKIFWELKVRKKIQSYSLNNYAVTAHHEFVFPLYTFKLVGTDKVTRYEDSRCIEVYRDGFSVPLDDYNFESPEFMQLKNLVCRHVQEYQDELEKPFMTKKPAMPFLVDYIQPHMNRESHTNSSQIPTPTNEPFNFRDSDRDLDEQWPKPGQNPSMEMSDIPADSSRESSPMNNTMIVSKATHSTMMSYDKSPKSLNITSTSIHNHIFFSPINLPMLMGPRAEGPLNESMMGSPPISNEFIQLQPIDPFLNNSERLI
jgi:hypothetical protein